MSAIRANHEPLTSSEVETRATSSAKTLGQSDGATLIALGVAIAGAESGASIPGSCSLCRSDRDLQSSTAEYSNVFCSKECEQEFVRKALAAVTVEDCMRIHRRLETLLMGVQEPR
jgi:hypothetical protein